MSTPAQTIDFQTPFDPTAYTQITATQLEQLVGGLGPSAGIGLIVATVDDNNGNPTVPNPATTPKWTNYAWLRVSPILGGVALYVWNPQGSVSATLLQWQIANIASIGAGTITGNQIAALTITDNNIASVGWGKIIAVGNAPVGGCLVGSLPNPTLANLSISSSNINPGSITGGLTSASLILAATVTGYNIAATTITNANLTTTDNLGILDSNVSSIASGNGLNAVGASGKIKIGAASTTLMTNAAATQCAWVLDYFAELSQVTGLGTAKQVPQVNAGATGLQWFTPSFTTGFVALVDPNNANFPVLGTPTAIPHTLGAKPSYVRVVALSVAGPQGGYTLGDEVDLTSFIGSDGTAYSCPFSVAADATYVKVVINSTLTSSFFKVINKGGSASTAVTLADWQFKLYAAL